MWSERKPVTLLESPRVEISLSTIQKALSEHKTLLIIGECRIDYRGRASSKLEPGDRIVIIKEDGSVLVHRPSDYSPVNWQPPGCLFETKAVEDELVIRAIRQRPKETIRIFFMQIYAIGVLDLVDEGDFSLFASEDDMQKAILANPDLIEPGFRPISHEKRVEPGFVDVYGIDERGRLVVIEIKRKTAGKTAVLQLAKYLEAIRDSTNREIRGVLVAPEISRGTQPLLATLNLEFKALSPRKCAEILSKARTRKILDFF